MDIRNAWRRVTVGWRRAPRWQKGSSIALAVIVLLIIIGAAAGGGNSSPKRTAQSATGSPTATPTVDSTTPTEAPSPPVPATTTPAASPTEATSAPPSSLAPATPPAPVVTTPTITSFGATDQEWNATHTEDTEFAPGAVYDADPSLPEVNGHTGAKYTEVLHTAGHVTSYSLNLHDGTKLAQATAATTADFPADTTLLWTANKDTCAQAEFRSATLGAALSDPSTGDPTGDVFVEFTTGDGYDPSNVTQVLVGGLGDYPTAQDAPGC